MGVLAVLISFTEQVEAIFGEIGYTNPLFILAVYSPGIAAVGLVWHHYGPVRAAASCRSGHSSPPSAPMKAVTAAPTPR